MAPEGFALLKWRVISATIIITGLLGLFILDWHFPLGTGGVWLVPLIALISVLMVRELLDLWRERPDCPQPWPVYISAPLTVVAAAAPLLGRVDRLAIGRHWPAGALEWLLPSFVFGVCLAFVGEMTRYRQPGRSTGSIALSVLALVYCGLLLSFLVQLRLLQERGNDAWGLAALLSLIITAKLSDMGAYFVGRQFGKHKLAPLLSPNKTVEGAVGALLAACLGALMCAVWLVPALLGENARPGRLWAWLLFGLLVAVTGMLGDLAESVLKRDACRKDSSRWLPGLGGVLDILDSIVFAAAPAFFYVRHILAV